MNDQAELSSNNEQDDDDLKPLSFVLDYGKIPVSLFNQDDPNHPKKCSLREFDGFTRDKYLNKNKGKIRNNEISDFTDLVGGLLELTLYNEDEDRFFTQKEIRELPSKLQYKLYERAIRLCGLDQKAEDKAKNA